MKTEGEIRLPDEKATIALGKRLARAMVSGAVIFLQGELGTGKTTLCRGVLRGLGHEGPVKSPTFTLVEPYELACGQVCHFDLYRLADPEELEFIGLRDYLRASALCLFEWPERGQGHLPVADLTLAIDVLDQGRLLRWHANTAAGQRMMRSSEMDGAA